MRTLFLVASCPSHASALLGGEVFDQPVMKLMVIIASATDDLRAIYDQAGSSSADVRDYEPGQESAAMRALGQIGTARRGKGVVWSDHRAAVALVNVGMGPQVGIGKGDPFWAQGVVQRVNFYDGGIGAFVSKFQPQPFMGEEKDWRDWARIFRSWSG